MLMRIACIRNERQTWQRDLVIKQCHFVIYKSFKKRKFKERERDSEREKEEERIRDSERERKRELEREREREVNLVLLDWFGLGEGVMI